MMMVDDKLQAVVHRETDQCFSNYFMYKSFRRCGFEMMIIKITVKQQ